MSITKYRICFDDETTCITVDNDSHLFLTDGYTVNIIIEKVSLCLREISLFPETEALALFSKETLIKIIVKKRCLQLLKWRG